MRAQHRRLAHADRRPVAVVTDSSADLADSVLDRHHITVVPLQVVFGTETFRDRIDLKPDEFYRRLSTARELPTTSQPTPADFVRVLRDARAEPTSSSRCRSGTLGHLTSAKGGPSGRDLERPPGDSRSASPGVWLAPAARSWPRRVVGVAIAGELERVGPVGDAPDGHQV
jgi:hypothetical protein